MTLLILGFFWALCMVALCGVYLITTNTMPSIRDVQAGQDDIRVDTGPSPPVHMSRLPKNEKIKIRIPDDLYK